MQWGFLDEYERCVKEAAKWDGGERFYVIDL
jgi:hypothetical protein